MARRLTRGDLLRQIRRRLEREGYEASVTMKPRPLYRSIMSPTIIETKVSKLGVTWTLHHCIGEKHTPSDVERVLDGVLTGHPGLNDEEIEEILKLCGKAVKTGEGYWPLITKTWFGSHASIQIPMILLDSTCQEAEMVLRYTPGQSVSGDINVRQENRWFVRHISADRKRRTRTGNPKSLVFGFLLQEVLDYQGSDESVRKHMIRNIRSAKKEMHGAMTSDDSEITIERIVAQDKQSGLRYRCENGRIEIYNQKYPWGSIDTNTIFIKGRYPQSVAISLPGKRLGDMIGGLPLDPELVIERAVIRKNPAEGISLGVRRTTK